MDDNPYSTAPTVNIDGDKYPVIYMSCDCTTYPIVAFHSVGKCGKCGVRPTHPGG